jgi:hypothetical protein
LHVGHPAPIIVWGVVDPTATCNLYELTASAEYSPSQHCNIRRASRDEIDMLEIILSRFHRPRRLNTLQIPKAMTALMVPWSKFGKISAIAALASVTAKKGIAVPMAG